MPAAAMEPEFELAVACCRWSYSGESAEEIQRLSREIDWSRFDSTIRRHRVQTLAALALTRNGIDPPSPFCESILGSARSVAARNLRSAAENHRLARAFSDAGVDLLFVKGLTLSALAYGDPFLKMSADIDFLIESQTVGQAAELLLELGYEPLIPLVGPSSALIARWHQWRKESDWLDSRSGLKVDLHTSLTDNDSLIPQIGMHSPRQMVEVTADWSFPTLATGDLYTYLSVHGTWSAWFRLKWLSDIAALIHRLGAGSAERLHDHAISRGAGRPSAQALLLANRLFGLDLAPSLRKALDRDPVNGLLSAVALRELRQGRSPIERRLGTLVIHLMRPMVLPGLRFKCSEFGRQLRDVAGRLTRRG